VRFANFAGEGVQVELELDEARLLRGLIDEMRTLLEADIPDTDAVKQRLFPAAYEDEAQANEFRELIQDDLHRTKLETLRAVSDRLGKTGPLVSAIPPDEVAQWLTLMTDLRLAIGTRLDVDETKMETDLDPEHPDAPAMSVLHWLGWMQESLLRATTEPGPTERTR
jgi:hypothetical protein